MIFCDTSFAAKLYVPEDGTDIVQSVLMEAEQVFVSELFRVELLSVFHRRLRERRCSREDFNAVMEQFRCDDLGGFWTWLPVEHDVIHSAAKTYETLPTTLCLRSADCIHLATALHHDSRQCTHLTGIRHKPPECSV